MGVKCHPDGELQSGRKAKACGLYPASRFIRQGRNFTFFNLGDMQPWERRFFILIKRKNGIGTVRTLTTSAMLTALSIVIGIFCKNFLNFGNGLFRITFENFPIILSGIMFGPLVGALVGIASDVLSFILSTQSFAISPIVTLGAALVGFMAGVVSHYVAKREGLARIILSVLSAHFIGSVIVKSVGLFVYYNWLVLWRIPVYFVIATLEAIVICAMYKNKTFYKLMKGISDDLH